MTRDELIRRLRLIGSPDSPLLQAAAMLEVDKVMLDSYSEAEILCDVKPLTEEQIRDAWNATNAPYILPIGIGVINFARAVEAKHRIGGWK